MQNWLLSKDNIVKSVLDLNNVRPNLSLLSQLLFYIIVNLHTFDHQYQYTFDYRPVDVKCFSTDNLRNKEEQPVIQIFNKLL